jgi:hypothetical protein
MEGIRIAPGQVFVDVDKRNVGFRLVQFERTFFGLDRYGERVTYAACRILTAGGRPCDFTDTPWLKGTGAVGQITYIRLDRLLTLRFYIPAPQPSFEMFEQFHPLAA